MHRTIADEQVGTHHVLIHEVDDGRYLVELDQLGCTTRSQWTLTETGACTVAAQWVAELHGARGGAS